MDIIDYVQKILKMKYYNIPFESLEHIYGEPVWDWDEDYIGATVTRTCTYPNCKHSESVLAEFVVATLPVQSPL